ncbi:IclR family transcriptional regulator [Actinophytocola sp.]|uniref:IclR family transcriptional regulator n=1 Tax=Actinophytocola sp. TaxID=1872138 RepID=UPI002ED6540A
MRNSEPSRGGVQSVDRAMAILDMLARQGEVGVTEIAHGLDVHKSTAFRLVEALEAWQLVEQVSERGKYRLGFGIVRLAGATTARLDLSRESRVVCERLAAELDETVNVAIVDQGQATNVMQVYGSAAVTARNWIGQRTPMHATSSGKVLLAWSADEEGELALGELIPFTPNTRTDRAKLADELAEVRERGWACTVEELEVGLNAVAAPIRAADGGVVAALSVSGPAYRVEPASYSAIAEKVVTGADEISFRIGYLGPR